MKKGKLLLNIAIGIIICIVAIPCLILLFSRISGSAANHAEVYYWVGANSTLKCIERMIPADQDTANAAWDLLQEMKETATKDGMISAIPESVEFQSVRLEEQTAVVDLSSDYLALKNSEEVVCRSAIVWTLTSLDRVEQVEMTVDGQPLRTKTGNKIGDMNRQNVQIDVEIPAETTEYAILKLYFANEMGTDFRIEDRVVEVNTNQARERTILEQLIAGPLETGLYATIPQDTKIRDVTTTDDGICYVNFSQDFISKAPTGNVDMVVAVYSVVNSLCELDNVDRVQFLIEGEKVDNVDGHLEFSTPFEAVEDVQTIALRDKT